MLIVHFSLTPLVGSPIRISRALNLHENITSRVVVLDPEGYVNQDHPTDLIWGNDKEEIIELVKTADIIHLHNYIDLDSTEFSPINFRQLWNENKPLIRQFHSTPQLIARMTNLTTDDVLRCPIPKISIAQYPERFYPNARLVPNIVFDVEDCYLGQKNHNRLIIGYSPSNLRSARSTRWDTKGYPETTNVLNSFKKSSKKLGLKTEIDLIEQVSHAECLQRKAKCDIAIDDLVTGSYHMSSLESALLGSVVLTYMDKRVENAVASVTGRNDFPVFNVRLEETEEILLELSRQPDLVKELGIQTRQWMLKNWSAEKMSFKFLECYEAVIENPKKPFPNRFNLNSPTSKYKEIDFYDHIWKARHKTWPPLPPKLISTVKSSAWKTLHKLGLK